MTPYICHAVALTMLMLLGAQITYTQTFIGIDTLNIKSSKSRSAIVPQADTNVTLRLPRSSGTIALESNGVTSAASTGTALAYVADTTITGGDWVTVAELQVDSGKGGILEHYFQATGNNGIPLAFYQEYSTNQYRLVDMNNYFADPNVLYYKGQYLCTGPGYRCMDGVAKAPGNWAIPFAYALEITGTGTLVSQGDGAIYRKGIIAFAFQDVAQLPGNIDMQNNYQIAKINGNYPNYAFDIWHAKYTFIPTSSGLIRLKVKNFRGVVSRGIGTLADCCGNILINVNSNVRLQKVMLVLH